MFARFLEPLAVKHFFKHVANVMDLEADLSCVEPRFNRVDHHR